MKAIIFILFVLCIGCSSSTDSSKPFAANPDLTGTWNVHYEALPKSSDSVITIQTNTNEITYNGKRYKSQISGISASWSITMTTGIYWEYSIVLDNKDAFNGYVVEKTINGYHTIFLLTGKRQ